MKPPKSIQVGPYRFAVEVTEETINKAAVKEKQTLLGYMDGEHQRLLLKPGMAHDCERDTLLHECVHALLYNSGLKFEDEEQEEAIVRTLSPALLDLLRRNPRLIEYLTEKP